jgi:hypothetical protein
MEALVEGFRRFREEVFGRHLLPLGFKRNQIPRA